MILLTAVGKDRPGIAAHVTRVLYEARCNIEDSTMTILCGEFAILLMLSTPAGLDAKGLDAEFESLRRETGLHVAVRDLPDEDVTAPPAREGSEFVVSVTGADKPGIVWRVTDLLAKAGANITDLESKVVSSGPTRVYVLVLEIALASGHADLDERLALLASEIGVEIRIHPLDTAAL